MKINLVGNPRWATASFGDARETHAMELSDLGDHLAMCKELTGRLFPVQCVAEVMHGFMSSRFVTTLVAIALLFTVSSMIV